MDSDLEAKNSTIVFGNGKKSYAARQWRDRRRLAGREAESLTGPMKEFGFYPSSKMKPWTSFKWRNHMMRFACSEHLRSPQSDHQFHLPHNHTLLEGPAKAVCLEQLAQPMLTETKETLSSFLGVSEQDISVYRHSFFSPFLYSYPHTFPFLPCVIMCLLPATLHPGKQLTWNSRDSGAWHSVQETEDHGKSLIILFCVLQFIQHWLFVRHWSSC